MPLNYSATVTTKDRIDDVRIAFTGGNVKDFTVEPPVGPNPDRIAVTDADRHNVVDPMISTMNYVAGSGDPFRRNRAFAKCRCSMAAALRPDE